MMMKRAFGQRSTPSSSETSVRSWVFHMINQFVREGVNLSTWQCRCKQYLESFDIPTQHYVKNRIEDALRKISTGVVAIACVFNIKLEE